MTMPSATSSILIFTLGNMLEKKKKETLCRLIQAEGLGALADLFVIGSAVAAGIVPNTRSPALHAVQFPCHFSVSLSKTLARFIRKTLFPTQQRPSESSENLVPRGGTEAQELENLEPRKRSHFNA